MNARNETPRRLLLLNLALLATTVAASSPANQKPHSPARTPAAYECVEEKLGVIPDDSRISGDPLVDCHGWHYGLALWTPGGKRLWLDGKLGPEFEDLVDAKVTDVGLQYDFAFSQDGKHLAYGARRAGKCLMVLDGKPDRMADDVNRPTFSPDGRHLAYVMKREGKVCLVQDTVPGSESDDVCGQIRFSPNGERIAYLVRHGKEYRLVVDQKEEPGWPSPSYPVFSPDSQHIAYTTTTRSGTSLKAFAVLDRRKGPEFPANSLWGPVFSADSQHFAFSIRNSVDGVRHERAFVDWLPLPLPNNGTGVWHVAFSPDLKRWACMLKIADKERVVLDGNEGAAFDGAYGLTFSPDNRRFAYMAQVKTNWWMVVDGKREAEIDLGSSHPYFSPDGKRLAYIAGRGPLWWMVVDGKVGPKFKGTKGTLGILSIQEEELPALTLPQFSPDSRHVAYAALQSNQWSVLMDSKAVGGKYERIIQGGPAFHPDGSLEFLGIRDRMLYRIKARLKKQGTKIGQKP